MRYAMPRGRSTLAAEAGLLILFGGILATLAAFVGGGSDASSRVPAAFARPVWLVVALAPAVSFLVLARRTRPAKSRRKLFCLIAAMVVPLNVLFFIAALSGFAL
jgi:hypothetical protein